MTPASDKCRRFFYEQKSSLFLTTFPRTTVKLLNMTLTVEPAPSIEMTKFSQLNPETISTIVVSRSDMMRQSLQAMLAAHSYIRVIDSAGNGLTARNQVIRYQPELLVIDSNLSDEEIKALLAEVKLKAPETRCLICVQSSRRRTLLLAAGADVVISRNDSAQQWQQVLLKIAREISASTTNDITG